MKISKTIPVNNKGMKQLSDCGRVIYQFCNLEINGFNFSNITCKDKPAINQLFGLPQHCSAKWGRWVGDYKKLHFFPESMAYTLLQNWGSKNIRNNSVRQGQKIKILISKGKRLYFGEMGEGEGVLYYAVQQI